ncbi:MAG TPA: AsmA family protein [Burkholderiales bacterium]|nr:AsmA family protein [Burkholderiales bacterium]
MENPSKSRKRILIGVGIALVSLLVVLLVVPFLLPLGRFIPEIERAASEQLKAPVRIASLSLFLLPTPHLTVGRITVGEKPFLEVEKVIVRPRLSSLLDSQRVIREISLRGVVIRQALIGKASRWASKPGAARPAPVRIEHIEVRDAFVDLNDFKLREIDIDLDLTPESALANAEVRADRDHLKVALTPRGKVFAVELSAQDWKMPAGPPLLLSSLTSSGILDPGQGLSLPKIEGRLYEGTLAGKLNVGWAKGWSIVGNLDIHGVEIKPVVALFTKDTTISGRLTANPVVDMHAPGAAQLGEAIDVESDFKVENGILYNFDLANAPKALLNKDALKGGQTGFDNLSGHVGVDAAGYYLTKLEITSGVLSAQGEAFISTKQDLSGQIDVAIRGTSGLVSTPLALSGTVQNPWIYPSTTALAGAAAGTALLGPGLGTTVGMKAARFTQRLFGGKPAKKAMPEKQDPKKQPEEPAAAADKKPQPAAHTGR